MLLVLWVTHAVVTTFENFQIFGRTDVGMDLKCVVHGNRFIVLTMGDKDIGYGLKPRKDIECQGFCQ